MAALRLVFMGTPSLACVVLRSLVDTPDFQVAAVVTQPDRPKGRQLHLQPSPVKELAEQLKLPVLQPEQARAEDFLSQLRNLAPDLVAVAAYGQILPPALLELPRFGCLNVHTSLLPRFRGAAPIQWAILRDEAHTGVTIMKMDEGLDTGPILSQDPTPILPEDTSETLHDRLAQLGAKLLCQTILPYVAGQIQPRPQTEAEATYAPRIKKQDGRIDWNRSAREIWNRIRGLVPWPGAFCYLAAEPAPRLLKIWEAEPASGAGSPGEILHADREGILVGCGEGALRLRLIQQEGGRRLSVSDFLAGHPLATGQHFS